MKKYMYFVGEHYFYICHPYKIRVTKCIRILTLFLLRITYFRYIQIVTKYERKTTSKLRSDNTSQKLTTLYVTVKYKFQQCS